MNRTHFHMHPLLKALIHHLKHDAVSRALTSSTGFKEMYA